MATSLEIKSSSVSTGAVGAQWSVVYSATPKLVIVVGNGISTGDGEQTNSQAGRFVFGFFSSAALADQRVIGISRDQNVANSNGYAAADTDLAHLFTDDNTATVFGAFKCVAYGTTVTFEVVDVYPSAYEFTAIGIISDLAVNVHVDDDVEPGAAGIVQYTAPGFEAKTVVFASVQSNPIGTIANQAKLCIGVGCTAPNASEQGFVISGHQQWNQPATTAPAKAYIRADKAVIAHPTNATTAVASEAAWEQGIPTGFELDWRVRNGSRPFIYAAMDGFDSEILTFVSKISDVTNLAVATQFESEGGLVASALTAAESASQTWTADEMISIGAFNDVIDQEVFGIHTVEAAGSLTVVEQRHKETGDANPAVLAHPDDTGTSRAVAVDSIGASAINVKTLASEPAAMFGVIWSIGESSGGTPVSQTQVTRGEALASVSASAEIQVEAQGWIALLPSEDVSGDWEDEGGGTTNIYLSIRDPSPATWITPKLHATIPSLLGGHRFTPDDEWGAPDEDDLATVWTEDSIFATMDQWPITIDELGNVYTVGLDGNGVAQGTKQSNNIIDLVGGAKGPWLSSSDIERYTPSPDAILIDVLWVPVGANGRIWGANVEKVVWNTIRLYYSDDRGVSHTDVSTPIYDQDTGGDPAFGRDFQFIKFGAGYTNVPDHLLATAEGGSGSDYVYVFARDGTADDDLVLLRAPIASLDVKANHRYYAGLDGSSNPIWATTIASRVAIHSNAGKVGWAPRIQWHTAIENYTLTYFDNSEGSGNGQGSWFCFYADKPWGPWTQLFRIDGWIDTKADNAAKFGFGFPAHWHIAPVGDEYIVQVVWSGVSPAPNQDKWQTSELLLEVG